MGVQVGTQLFMSQPGTGATRRLLRRPPSPTPRPCARSPLRSVTGRAGCTQRDATGELLEGAVGSRSTMSLGPGPVSGRGALRTPTATPLPASAAKAAAEDQKPEGGAGLLYLRSPGKLLHQPRGSGAPKESGPWPLPPPRPLPPPPPSP